jgi:hypothetical protein
MAAYFGDFENWADVQRSFEMQDPEPDEVFYADYDQPPYEGYAFVAFRRGDKYFTAHGSHCSCYGLEGQWAPEQYDDKEQFTKCLGLRNDSAAAATLERVK